MADPEIISQLVTLIEKNYKEKTVVTHQLKQLEKQLSVLQDQIQTFEKTLSYLDPKFDFKRIRKKFDAGQLMRVPLFEGNLQRLIAEVLKQEGYWLSLYSLTNTVVALDKGLQSIYHSQATREHQCAVGNVLRKLYKQGLLERREKHLHYKVKKRGIFERSEWRLKKLEQE